MTIEICVEDLAQSLAAERAGAHRLELCADLHNGGTTPSFGMIRTVSTRCSIPVFVMIRPRGGNFAYTESEMAVMLADISAAAAAGARGVVFGALHPDGSFHVEHNVELLRIARLHQLQVTFHRAIDVCRDPLAVLELLAELGFDNVLTSGGKPKAEECLEIIASMVRISAGRIKVMAGSGVNPENAERIKNTRVHALHFTARKPQPRTTVLDMGMQWLPDEEKVEKVINTLRTYE